MKNGSIGVLRGFGDAINAVAAMGGQSFLLLSGPYGVVLERGLSQEALAGRIKRFAGTEGRRVWLRAFNAEKEVLWNRSYGLLAEVGRGKLDVEDRYYELEAAGPARPGMARLWETLADWHGPGALEPGSSRIAAQDFSRDGKLMHIKLARISL